MSLILLYTLIGRGDSSETFSISTFHLEYSLKLKVVGVLVGLGGLMGQGDLDSGLIRSTMLGRLKVHKYIRRQRLAHARSYDT